MADIIVRKANEAFLQIECEESIHYELSSYFAFHVPNYKYTPEFKAGTWDGQIRLYNLRTRQIYTGLIHKIAYFAKTREYTIKYDLDLSNFKDEITFDPRVYNPPFEPDDYQENAINEILRYKRRLILSPTSSGKAFIIYNCVRWLLANRIQGKQALIVVPTTPLVEQMCKEFDEYGWSSEDNCHKIYSGKEKTSSKPVIITTWQSVYKMPKRWFRDFSAVFVDEAHLAQARSIRGIMEKCENASYRVGLTGTIEDTKTHKLVLQGIFGKIYSTIKTSELMDRGRVADLSIHSILLKHRDEDCQIVSKMKYQDEIKTVISNEKRNKFVCKLADTRKGNTLILFNYVKLHGEPLFKMMQKMTKKKVFFVHGDTSTETREAIREYTEKNHDVIIIASYGTFSTGINIKNLENVIFAHPMKSKIKNLQSIGRVLRKQCKDAVAFLYDIGDDYRWKTKENTTLKHFKMRLKLYIKENFKYHVKTIQM